ncbi:MAG: CpaE family protein [Bryobacteraceae bacterium]
MASLILEPGTAKSPATPSTVGLAVSAPELWAPLQETLRGLAVRVVMEQRDLGNWASLLERLEFLRPEVVLLDITSLPMSVEDAVRAVRAALPDVMLVALDKSAEPDAILTAMRAGANEFLYPPFGNNLRNAISRRAEVRPRPRENNRPSGKVLGFLAAKGGSGASTIACHLAAELGRVSAQRAEHSLLADLDLQSGIVGFLMKVKSPYSVLDAVQNLHRLDVSYWNALVSSEWPGLEIIAAPNGYLPKDPVSGEALRQVVAFVRAHYSWTVADLGSTLNLATVTVLEEVDDVFLVTTLEVPSLHQAKQAVQTLINAGFGNRLHVILNRTPQRPDVTAEELERILGLPIDTMLPNDYYALYDAFCKGKLLPPGSHLSRQLSSFAMRLAGTPVEKSKRRFGLFG